MIAVCLFFLDDRDKLVEQRAGLREFFFAEAFYALAREGVENFTHFFVAFFRMLRHFDIRDFSIHVVRNAVHHAACFQTITGHGIQGYFEAIDALIEKLSDSSDERGA